MTSCDVSNYLSLVCRCHIFYFGVLCALLALFCHTFPLLCLTLSSYICSFFNLSVAFYFKVYGVLTAV